MKGLIIYNDYWSSARTDYCCNQLIDYCKSSGINIQTLSGREVSVDINKVYNLDLDFVIMRDKFPLIAKSIEDKGIRVFNSSKSIRICDDKAEMSIAFNSHEIPTPHTIISPQTYQRSLGLPFIQDVEEQLGYPVIIKDIHSSLGIGVSIAYNSQQLYKYAKSIKPLIFQEFIPITPAQDIRAYVVNNEVIGCISRIACDGDFRSNIELGSIAKKCTITDKCRDLAIKAMRAVGSEFGGVDIIPLDEPIVLEVNANAGFKSLDELNNIKTASYIIKYIQEALQ